jgi:hypothetical protein
MSLDSVSDSYSGLMSIFPAQETGGEYVVTSQPLDGEQTHTLSSHVYLISPVLFKPYCMPKLTSHYPTFLRNNSWAINSTNETIDHLTLDSVDHQ